LPSAELPDRTQPVDSTGCRWLASNPGASRGDPQRQLQITRWRIPGLIAAIAILDALQGEQQRSAQQLGGIAGKGIWLLGAAG
jgi:hypothetical protein